MAKNKGGRPTTYKQEYCDDIIEYFNEQKETIYYEYQWYRPQKVQVEEHYQTYGSESSEHEMNGGKKSVSPKIIKSNLPTFERWCANKLIPKSTFYDWAKDNKEFSDSLEICKQIQEAILIEMGLNGIYNSTITQLMLKNNHGRTDKREVEHSGEMKQITSVIYEEDGAKD